MLSPKAPIEAARERNLRRRPPAAARPSCIVAGAIALIIAALLLLAPHPAAAQPVRGEASAQVLNGHARLVIKLSEEVETQVRISGNVLVIHFRRPVDVAIDRVRVTASEYIGAARRDPDGRALRFALARKIKINQIAAAERLFVDLLPEDWQGEPPGLPQEIVEELARRTRDAEKEARKRAELEQLRKVRPVNVRVAKLPTFTRYIFELPELTGVTTDRGKNNLTLKFARPLRFDLADAKLAGADGVDTIDAVQEMESSEVKFGLGGQVDIRSFREDLNFVVDITALDAKPQARSDAEPARNPATTPAPLAGLEPPKTVPAKTVPDKQAHAPDLPAAAPLPLPRPAQTMPGVGEDRPAAEPKPEQKAAAAPQPQFQQPPQQKPAAAEPPAQEAKVETKIDAKPEAKLEAKLETKLEPKPAPKLKTKVPSAPHAAQHDDSTRPLAVEVRRQGDGIRLTFPFGSPTPAAVFQRAQTLWLVFDTRAKLDLAAFANDPSRSVRAAETSRAGDSLIVRLRLERPRLASVVPESNGWTVALSDQLQEPTKPLMMGRNVVGPSRTTVTIPFEEPAAVHYLKDPDIGDTLLVVTALGPARGFIKNHDFIEFRTLASSHGVAVQPHADDIAATLAGDKIELGRPGGLTLSESLEVGRRVSVTRSVTFDQQLWNFDREAKFAERQQELITGAAGAMPGKRSANRLDLARFYLSRGLFTEAKAVLDVTIQDDKQSSDNPTALVLRSFANIMLDRADQALKDLANPLVGDQHNAQLWRALAYARQGKWSEAREHFRDLEAAMSTLPVEVQRIALKERLRAAVEVGDFGGASATVSELETIGVAPEQQPHLSVLTGRLAEGLGRPGEALDAYRNASASHDRLAASQGRLREIALRQELGEANKSQLIGDLEAFNVAWRGDETEIEALKILAKLYTEDQRYRDAFQVMRTAFAVRPGSPLTRKIHEDVAATFDQLYLDGRGDSMPPIDALGLFYDFRDLTPVGRRGDEMIRRLADRLVAVDLLDPAAELLQHQVDNRLQGAARAQVATRLAVIYLLNNKPQQAQAALRSTRSGHLSSEIRNQRMLIEGRAMSDIGRHDLALEVIANLEGREAMRLRADINWAARRWQQAGEQIELLLGDRWKNTDPLAERERADLLRAGIAYALADDSIAMGRLRERYATKIADPKDQHAFEVVLAGLGTNSAEFREVARTIAAVDTLDSFVRDLQARYPDMHVLPASTGGQPSAAAPPPRADREPTGSIAPRDVPRPVPSRAPPR